MASWTALRRLAGVAVTVGVFAVLLRWALEPTLIVDYEISMTMNVPDNKVMEFFIQHPDIQSLYPSDGESSPRNVILVSTVHMTESVTQHTLTLYENVPVLNRIDYKLHITCDREANSVKLNSTGKAWGGMVTLFPEHTIMLQDVDGVQTNLVDHFSLYGNRFLAVFQRTAYEVGKKQHRLMFDNLKNRLQGAHV